MRPLWRAWPSRPMGAESRAGRGRFSAGRVTTPCGSGTWNPGPKLAVLRGHKDGVTSVAFSPDGHRIAGGFQAVFSGPSENTVRLWDAESGAELAVLRGHKDGVTSVAFSPDGRRIASGSWGVFRELSENAVRLWDAESGAELAVLRGHEDGVSSVAFSPDGRRIASGSRDKTVRLWDARSGQCVQVIQGTGDVSAIAACPMYFPCRALARDDETVVERAVPAVVLARFPAGIAHIATHPNGRTWVGTVPNHLYLLTLEGVDRAGDVKEKP